MPQHKSTSVNYNYLIPNSRRGLTLQGELARCMEHGQISMRTLEWMAKNSMTPFDRQIAKELLAARKEVARLGKQVAAMELRAINREGKK
jgi:hypothetical protein